MSYPVFKKGLPGTTTDAAGRAGSPNADQIRSLSRRGIDDPAGYVVSEELAQAINVSLILGMPLLVTGEPGTGKSQLGRAIAHELNAGVPYMFETKSTSQARDLFYTFDVIGRFGARDVGASTDPRAFIRYHALGEAILNAFPRARVEHLLPIGTSSHTGPKRSVVIVDEIDKAPRDFSNDLLNEIDRMAFRILELQNAATPGLDDGGEGVPAELRPIVVITSNSEKGLPDAFLRRCVYFHIPFPSVDELRTVVANRIERLDGACNLVDDALDLFGRLRDERTQPALRKKPATAELLNWLQFLTARGLDANTRLRRANQVDALQSSLYALVKNKEDLEAATDYARRWANGEA
jgi:MoxR-like ATPase